MTRGDAAEFLGGYKKSKKRKRYLETILKEMESEKGSEKRCREIRKEIKKKWKDMQYVIACLDLVTCESGREVLFDRFIRGWSIRETAEKEYVSERHVQRITNKALDELALRLDQQ